MTARKEVEAATAPAEEAPPFDVAFTIGGVRWNVKTVDELEAASAVSPTVYKKVKEIEQASIAAGVFQPKAAPDPKKSTSTAPAGDVPSCAHGLMNDVRGKVYGPKSANAGKPYPKSFYCSQPWNAADKCEPRD